MSEVAPQPPAPPPPGYRSGRLAVQALVGIIALFLVLAALGAFYREQTLALSAAYVETFGGPGLFVGWAFLDFFPGPIIPHDFLTTFAVVGGMGFWEAAAWASTASLVGGSLGWLAARRFAKTAFYLRKIQAGAARRVYHLVERHAALTLALGALSPLPYSVAAWACSAAGMPYRRFIVVSLLRPVRVVFYLWLLEIGAVNALG